MTFSMQVRVLFRTFKRHRWQFLLLVVFGMLGAVLEGIGINAAIPLVSFFTGVHSGPTDFISKTIESVFGFFYIPFTFRYLLGFILGLFLLRALVVALFGYIRGRVSADFMGIESTEMLTRALRASWPFLLRQKIGTLQATLVRDIQQTASLLEVSAQAVQSFSGFCMYLLIAMNISPLMTLCTVVGGMVLLFVVRPLLKRTQVAIREYLATEKNYTQFLHEHLLGMKTVKAAGMEERALQMGSRLVQRLRELTIRMALIRSISGSLFQPFSLVFVIILFAITYQSPDFSIVSFAATLYLIQKIFTYLESGQSALHIVSELVPYAENVEKFKTLFAEHKEVSTNGTGAFKFTKELTFDHVSFSYTEEREVLSDVHFAIPRGKTVGLIGPSGAGKTSVADILLRLFEPTRGRVLIDGKPISDVSLESWRQHTGYVSQDIFLLNASIEENIRFYRPELTQEAVIAAAKKANCYEFIESLPEQFATVVGDRGVLLSGGQRQRIALARALATAPELLILDEATSALDSGSEDVIQEAIQGLRGSVTVLVIAHRLTTVENADLLVVLDQGKVVETGSPKELLAQPNSYFARQYQVRS